MTWRVSLRVTLVTLVTLCDTLRDATHLYVTINPIHHMSLTLGWHILTLSLTSSSLSFQTSPCRQLWRHLHHFRRHPAVISDVIFVIISDVIMPSSLTSSSSSIKTSPCPHLWRHLHRHLRRHCDVIHGMSFSTDTYPWLIHDANQGDTSCCHLWRHLRRHLRCHYAITSDIIFVVISDVILPSTLTSSSYGQN